ncbi:hypothetical protein BJV82DRAFT_602885 [Fennellomyces sp. T-0311]|nr:hypothetical protein BJV82DRAFT_602885 [Fennellomyces sp. T-0311]
MEEQEQEAMAEEYVEQLQEEEEEQHDEGEAHPVEPGEDDRHEDVAPVIEAPAVNNQDTEDELQAAVEDLSPSEPAVEEQTREPEVKVRETEYFSDAVAASTAEERQPVEEEKTQAGGKKKKKAKKQKRRV